MSWRRKFSKPPRTEGDRRDPSAAKLYTLRLTETDACRLTFTLENDIYCHLTELSQPISNPQASSKSAPKTRQQHQIQNRSPESQPCDSADILEYLRDMRSEVRNDFSSINNKIDKINVCVNELKAENQSLNDENKLLWTEMGSMKLKMDILEGHSRRNNLRILGIDGSLNVSWSETERKVRDFIKTDLNMPEMENVEIERTHRKSRNPNKCTIIVKFTKFKDKDSLLNRATRVFSVDSNHRVHKDFTDRVRQHTRELSRRLV